jgi:hypothetical protein
MMTIEFEQQVEMCIRSGNPIDFRLVTKCRYLFWMWVWIEKAKIEIRYFRGPRLNPFAASWPYVELSKAKHYAKKAGIVRTVKPRRLV